MKILHTADWHLGKRLDMFSRLEEQREVLTEIVEIADKEDVDAVIVAGDLFDNFNPSSEATELLYSTLHRLSKNGTRAVIAIAGNHDSPERIEVPDALARACGIVFVGYPNAYLRPFSTEGGIEVLHVDNGYIELALPKQQTPLRLILTPYANEVRLKTYLGVEDTEDSLRQHLAQHWKQLADQYFDEKGVNFLVTHLFMMKNGGEQPEEPDDEKPILHVGGASAIFSENIPPQTQYVALGHLHRFQTIDIEPCPIIYSSSPLAYSFSEANQTKYVVVVEAEAGQPVSLTPVALTKGKKLLRNKFTEIEEAMTWLEDNQDAIVQITMVTESYLESADKKRLMEAHPMMMPIIPEVKNLQKGNDGTSKIVSIDNKSMEELFVEYFKNSKEGKGQAPSESLMELFKEIQSVEIFE
ncbi:metallophosphoesterase family protein [Flectobacillus rivi]|uniref:Nuclease SbcCD subunit D n=1 Tax=Flectobacillus rivi TaxID=2984209 RepID=A0ABT6Z8J9_9BACT|nr:exonuclease subunit SbcD [Flectobacillus rivi]MDI9877458.1 exonuclease subunit SbcD [Flectobacillus rivi]